MLSLVPQSCVCVCVCVCTCSWDFKQEERLGAGNFSEVYCVIHRQSGKRYALKKSRRPVATLQEKNMWLAVGDHHTAAHGTEQQRKVYNTHTRGRARARAYAPASMQIRCPTLW